MAWQRILALHSGVGIYSVAMIVASFMAGLGLGSHTGGRLSVGLTPSSALRAFGLLELGIGAFGAASAWLYYDQLYLKAAWLYAPAWRAGALHFLALLLPTALMGMTLPFLVRALVRDVPSAGRIIGLLYGINVLGASIGALLTPWVLVRFYGIRGAILAAAIGNTLSGLTAVLLSRRRLETPAGSEGVEAPPVTSAASHPLSLWIALYTLSGFCALSLEIVWFRMLELAVKASSFTFGTLLALYLLGNAGGCLAAVARRKRFARPLRSFLLCQCLLLIWSGIAVALVAFLPESTPGFNWFCRYWVRGTGYTLGQPGALERLLRVYLVFPLFLFGLPAALMGFSFPALQQAVQDDPPQSGRRVGILQAANISGCVAGSLLLGLLGLTLFGTTGSLRLLMLAGLAFALVGIRTSGARLFAPLAALLVLASVAMPGQGRLWGRLHGRKAGPDAFFDEDATGVAAIGHSKKAWIVYVNGKGHSWIPFGRMHSTLGAVPALVHPAPRDVAIIGLGSGDTAWASGCRPETASVRVFEIAGPQPRLLRGLAAQEELPDLRRFLADPRVTITIADGRNAVIQAKQSFDLIEADALWPDVAYSGNLYSVEFFEGCARKLKPGGVMCTWAPTDRVYKTFTSVFPHVIANRDRGMLIGSKDPLPIETAAWQRHLAEPAVVDYLGAVRPMIEQGLGELEPVNVKNRRRRELELNRDLFPRDEFRTP